MTLPSRKASDLAPYPGYLAGDRLRIHREDDQSYRCDLDDFVTLAVAPVLDVRYDARYLTPAAAAAAYLTPATAAATYLTPAAAAAAYLTPAAAAAAYQTPAQADARYIRADDGPHTLRDQTIAGALHVIGPSATDYLVLDVMDTARALTGFGAGLFDQQVYFYALNAYFDLQFTAFVPGSPGYAAGVNGSGHCAITMVSEPNTNPIVVIQVRHGTGEVWTGPGGGILELFGASAYDVTGNATKLALWWMASVAPSVNPPAGAAWVYLDPADGEFKYRKPDGTIRSMGYGVGNVTLTGTLSGSNGSSQTNARIAARASGNGIEWGHLNAAGFGSVLGADNGAGTPFLAFSAEAGTTANTYRTRGIKGSVFKSDLLGGFVFATLATATADNQALTTVATLTAAGLLTVAGALKSAAPAGGTSASWKLGTRVAAAVALVTTQYVELDVNGTLYKLATVA